MLPKISQPIKLIELRNLDKNKYLKSNVADLTADYLTITYPTEEHGGQPYMLSKNDRVLILYTGQDNCQYEFVTTVVDRKKENIPLYVLARPNQASIKRTQRREYFRVPTNLKLTVKMQTHQQVIEFPAVTMDISGGGLSFVCNNSIVVKHDAALTGTIFLPQAGGEMQSIVVDANVVRIVPPLEPKQHQRVSVTYTKIKEWDRDAIIRYCNAKQLELRKKGLI